MTELRTTLSERVFDYLRTHPGQTMTPRMLAHALLQSHPQWATQKKQRSAVLENDQQLLAQIAAEISSHYQAILAKYPQLNTTDVPPRAFFTQHHRTKVPMRSYKPLSKTLLRVKPIASIPPK